MKYLLDANIFIEADKHYYASSVVPSFWQWLEEDEDIYTINEIEKEVGKGDDSFLNNVIKKIKKIDTNLHALNIVTEYIKTKYKVNQNMQRFLSSADPLLIATALNKNITIVTLENKAHETSIKIKIPNVCDNFKIKYMNTFELLKNKNIHLSNYQSLRQKKSKQ